MAVMMSFETEKYCHLVSKLEASAGAYAAASAVSWFMYIRAFWRTFPHKNKKNKKSIE